MKGTLVNPACHSQRVPQITPAVPLSNFVLIEAEFKEFEPRLKFETLLKYSWFHLKLYLMFHDLSRRSIETGFGGFETRLKFIRFGLWGVLVVKEEIKI